MNNMTEPILHEYKYVNIHKKKEDNTFGKLKNNSS